MNREIIKQKLEQRGHSNPQRGTTRVTEMQNTVTEYPGWDICTSMNPAYWFKKGQMPNCRQMEELEYIGLQYSDQHVEGSDMIVSFESETVVREQASDSGMYELDYIRHEARRLGINAAVNLRPMGMVTLVFRGIAQGVPFETFHR